MAASRWSRRLRLSRRRVALAMYNLDDSIRDFAQASLRYGLDRGFPVYLSTERS
jgi:isocitrate dehydrogenase